MVAVAEQASALSRLSQAKEVAARLSLRCQELEQEEAQILQSLRHRQADEAETGELVLDADTLIASAVPVANQAAVARDRLPEVRGLIVQLKRASHEKFELMESLKRDASKEIVRGAEGDRWRKAVRKLAKAVAEVAAADAEVFQEQSDLQARLPDPAALKTVRFPPGPLASFEPGDLDRVCKVFAARLIEIDRYYGG